VHDRQVPVEHHHVVVVHAHTFERRAAVVHDVDRMRLVPQALGHRVREQRLVLDHQDPHVSMVTHGDVTSASSFGLTPEKCLDASTSP